MNRYSVFAIKSLTADGYPVAAACICEKDRGRESIGQMSRISEFRCAAINDPMYIDYRLADYIKTIAPSHIYCIGASIVIPGMSDPTGGIIGSPHKDINSANGDIEQIAEDLVLVSRPGGPGFIIQGDEQTARNIYYDLQRNCYMKSDYDRALSILNSMIKNNINAGIIVTDGSGPVKEGCVIAYESGRSNIIKIP